MSYPSKQLVNFLYDMSEEDFIFNIHTFKYNNNLYIEIYLYNDEIRLNNFKNLCYKYFGKDCIIDIGHSKCKDEKIEKIGSETKLKITITKNDYYKEILEEV